MWMPRQNPMVEIGWRGFALIVVLSVALVTPSFAEDSPAVSPLLRLANIVATPESGTSEAVSPSATRGGGKEISAKPTEPGKQAPPTWPNPFYAKSWAVVIGINRYSKWPGLEYAVNDAKAVGEKLKSVGFDEVIEVLDQEATRERLLELLGVELPKKVGKQDRVVIFFAGHGQTEELSSGRQKGYIIPVDASTQVFSQAISMEEVRELSERIPAKHIFYVIDACYSGLGLNRAGSISPTVAGYLRKVTSIRAIQMVTAGSKGEQVVEKNGHGLFTAYFLRALDGEADTDNDGVVTASELGAFLRPQVSQATDNRQTPQYGRLDGEGEVVFLKPGTRPRGLQVLPVETEGPEAIVVAQAEGTDPETARGAGEPPPQEVAKLALTPSGLDPHWLQDDDYFIAREPYEQGSVFVHLSKMKQAPTDQSQGEAQFLRLTDSREILTKHFWQTRPAEVSDLQVGTLALCFVGNQEGEFFRPPVDKQNARAGDWMLGRVSDISELDRGVVLIEKMTCSIAGTRLPTEDVEGATMRSAAGRKTGLPQAYQPKVISTAELTMIGGRSQPTRLGLPEAYQPKVITTDELTMTGSR